MSVHKYPVFSQIVAANLVVAVRIGAMTSSEAYAIGEDSEVYGKHYESAEVATCCIIDYDHAISDKKGTRVDELAQRFDELTVFEAWTPGDYRTTPQSKEGSKENEL